VLSLGALVGENDGELLGGAEGIIDNVGSCETVGVLDGVVDGGGEG